VYVVKTTFTAEGAEHCNNETAEGAEDAEKTIRRVTDSEKSEAVFMVSLCVLL
jgi:hypothetical protein